MRLLLGDLRKLIREFVGDAYDVIGVSPTATDDEIKRAYRKKAAALHPDHLGKNITNDDIKMSKKVNMAYAMLTHGPKGEGGRGAYDKEREWGTLGTKDDMGDLRGGISVDTIAPQSQPKQRAEPPQPKPQSKEEPRKRNADRPPATPPGFDPKYAREEIPKQKEEPRSRNADRPPPMNNPEQEHRLTPEELQKFIFKTHIDLKKTWDRAVGVMNATSYLELQNIIGEKSMEQLWAQHQKDNHGVWPFRKDNIKRYEHNSLLKAKPIWKEQFIERLQTTVNDAIKSGIPQNNFAAWLERIKELKNFKIDVI